MTTSFYCRCGYHYEGDGEPDWDHAPAYPDSCCNCGGQKCMDCCSRAVHDECRQDCPVCCRESTDPADGYFSEAEERQLADLIYDAPKGFDLVGFWCWRGGGHICDESCKSDSVPIFAQSGWAEGVRRNIRAGCE